MLKSIAVLFLLISLTLNANALLYNVVVYVSPIGSDNNDGRSALRPFATLERALRETKKYCGSTVKLMAGTFMRSAPLQIEGNHCKQVWMAYGDGPAVLDGNGGVATGIRIRGSDIAIVGLTVRNFGNNGIVLTGAHDIRIARNNIKNISSDGWNQAGILGMQVAKDIVISENTIESTGYAGIQFAAGETGDLSNPFIAGNTITDSCRSVSDCGAIYLSGRTEKSRGAVITRNKITNYGTIKTQSKAIYLDDFLSGASVSDNVIRGSGTSAFQIHGGKNNTFFKNRIYITKDQIFLIYQSIGGGGEDTMSGNAFRKNDIIGMTGLGNAIRYYGESIRPIFDSNLVGESE